MSSLIPIIDRSNLGMSCGAGFPSRAAFPAQVVSPRTAPLTRPSRAGSGRPAPPGPAVRLPRHLQARAKLEMLSAPQAARARPRLSRLRLPACRHPSRGNAPPPASPRPFREYSGVRTRARRRHIIYPPPLQLEMSSLSLLEAIRDESAAAPPSSRSSTRRSPAPGPREISAATFYSSATEAAFCNCYIIYIQYSIITCYIPCVKNYDMYYVI